ncbi:hypothetical protein KC19_2G113500 [Ceratodon purpureus]|uniref:Uncharacterized protein n=1 Tax=Ceratodon purpureus TaxID=3225 RepID=A0A8T0IWL5_CERPU|nr:hypothetical protein KC19_2G113500 [Ceratodon purpureus]
MSTVDVEPTPARPSILAQLPEGVVTHVATGPESLQHAVDLISEFGLPDGLLPLKDVVECGFNRETGYVWITQKKAIVHQFKQIGKQVSYGDKVTAYLEKGRLKKLTGVKAKEMLWVSIVEITVEEADKNNIFFKSFSGLGKTFPTKAFLRGADTK